MGRTFRGVPAQREEGQGGRSKNKRPNDGTSEGKRLHGRIVGRLADDTASAS